MKLVRTSHIGLIALFIAMVASLFITENGAAKLPPPEQFSVETKNFALNFEVGDDGRLYQRAVGAAGANEKLRRTDESLSRRRFDGYIWGTSFAQSRPRRRQHFNGVDFEKASRARTTTP